MTQSDNLKASQAQCGPGCGLDILHASHGVGERIREIVPEGNPAASGQTPCRTVPVHQALSLLGGNMTEIPPHACA